MKIVNYIPVGLIAVSVVIFSGCTNKIKPVINIPNNNQPTVNDNSNSSGVVTSTIPIPQNDDDYLTVAAAIATAAELNNQNICLRGYVETGEELAVMSGSYKEYNGRKVAQSPYIWLQWYPQLEQLECATNSVGQESCFGETTLCGTFSYAGTGIGFGHTNAYRYQLLGAEPASIPNTLDVAL